MKENYYQFGTIENQAKSFLARVKSFRQNKALKINPQKSALLIIDMQKYFLNETSHAFIPSMAAIIPNITKLQNLFLEQKLMLMQTKHGNTEKNALAMKRWWPMMLEANDPDAEIIKELCDPRIKVLEKSQYDAFWQTDLETRLKKRGIEQIIVTGVMAHLCCETTARSAFVRGFDVFFAADATATYNSEFHQAALLNLAHGFALPVLTEEIITAITNPDEK